MKAHLILVGLAIGALASHGSAQGIQFEWQTPPQGTSQFVSAGDVDGDGIADFARGAPLDSTTGDRGSVQVLSGADGSELLTVSGTSAGDRFGGSVAGLGNVDGVGGDDVVAYSGFGGVLRAFSGTGQTIWEVVAPAPWQFDADMEAIDDVDLDGVNDLIVSAQSPMSQEAAMVVSGANGTVVHTVMPGALGQGAIVAAVGRASDRDGDGVDEFFVTVHDPSQFLTGVVTVYSGRTASVLASYQGPGGESFGADVASISDLNSDGVDDYVVSSPREPISVVSRGRIRFVSGADGSVLRTVSPPSSNLWNFGEVVEVFPDFDGDGTEDVIISPGVHRVGCCAFVTAGAYMYSGANGDWLYASNDGSIFRGVVPDANGDGVTDYAVWRAVGPGESFDSVAVTGWSPPFTFCPSLKTTSQGCDPLIGAQGTPSLTLGSDLTLVAQRTIPNTTGLFLWSRGLDPRPFRGGQLCLANPIGRFGVTSTTSGQSPCPGSTANTGSMRTTIPKSFFTDLGFLPGDTIMIQGLFRDAGFAPPLDVGLTDSLVVTIWP